MAVQRVTQLQLENFASGLTSAEEAGEQALLSVADVQAKEMAFFQTLKANGKLTDDEQLPSWAERYQKLLTANVKPKIAAYVAWATMPKKYRWPETQEQLATQVLGLKSDRQIAEWRKKFPEIDSMISQLQFEEMMEYRPGVFHALGTVASDPSYRAAPDRKLFLEITQDYTPRQKILGDKGSPVGRKILDQLNNQPTAKLLELLGAEGLDMLKQFEEEVAAEEMEKAEPQKPEEPGEDTDGS